MSDARSKLFERFGAAADLGVAMNLLGWDQQVLMPPAGGEARALALASVERMAHELVIDPEYGRWLEQAQPADDREELLFARARRQHEKARRVPSDLAAELAHAASAGQEVWVRARAAGDFAPMIGVLERTIELKRRYAACFDTADPYDALLDDFDEGLTTAHVDPVFARLRSELPAIAAAIAASGRSLPSLPAPMPIAGQRALVADVLSALGTDEESWRLDDSAHPFSTGFAISDQRITTRWDEQDLSSLMAAIHEFGHGLYERQIDPALARTPAASGCGMTLHESQSRLWENMVGRGLPFAEWLAPRAAEHLPEQFAGVSAEDLHGALNVVAPSLIRVEADEVTYPLHVALRYGLERELLAGELAVADLPARWDAGMGELLGVEVPDVAHGVLQDVHWSAGLFGYFPTYALGTVVSAQVWELVRSELPELDGEIRTGEFGSLRGWLRERIHHEGSLRTPPETIERAIGAGIDADALLGYLRAKYSALYGVELS